MIGNPNWFKVRKWGGWGLTPASWQGWVYIVVIALPLVIAQSVLKVDANTFETLTLVWVSLILLDVFDMMIRLKRDEREEKHEAIAERNAAWFIVFVLAFGTIIKAVIARDPNVVLDPVIGVALFGTTAVKALTYWRLRNK